ncbi:hypothetical protein HOP50_02g10350 [Chloropicon primus]|uniref:Uncharacterized protein n=1 Tax=Chloropicon primus TaxID=1764295 RepID=A0A5B8ME41_9CHLO|nr:hypothetical protein A3770_02p10490 [Chloropicon primus]UPQ97740.1 hypothetical protein HOP50_02g10350 [Chloropicon primus]|eukprot:QDZ18531.1 hypothetical protein A3770_02p10490 [Chloropicon primus]
MSGVVRAVRYVGQSAVLAGGTFVGLCYFTMWNADQRVKAIDVEVREAGRAVTAAEQELERAVKAVEPLKAKETAMAAKVDDVKVNLRKAEEQVAKIKTTLSDYTRQLEDRRQDVKQQLEKVSLLQRMKDLKIQNVSVAKEALSAAQKEAINTRTEFDPVKRLQVMATSFK